MYYDGGLSAGLHILLINSTQLNHVLQHHHWQRKLHGISDP